MSPLMGHNNDHFLSGMDMNNHTDEINALIEYNAKQKIKVSMKVACHRSREKAMNDGIKIIMTKINYDIMSIWYGALNESNH